MLSLGFGLTAVRTSGGGGSPVAPPALLPEHGNGVPQQTWGLGAVIAFDPSSYLSGDPTAWAMGPGSDGLPAGLTLDAATGVISGTVAGSIPEGSIILRASNAGGFYDLTIPVAATPPVVIVADGDELLASSVNAPTITDAGGGAYRMVIASSTVARALYAPAEPLVPGATYRVTWAWTGSTISGGSRGLYVRVGLADMTTGEPRLDLLTLNTSTGPSIAASGSGEATFVAVEGHARVGVVCTGALGQGVTWTSVTVERITPAPSAPPYLLAPRVTVLDGPAATLDVDLGRYFASAATIGLDPFAEPLPVGVVISGGRLIGPPGAVRLDTMLRARTGLDSVTAPLLLDTREAPTAGEPGVTVFDEWNGGSLSLDIGDAPGVGETRVVVLLAVIRGVGATYPSGVTLTPPGESPIAMTLAPGVHFVPGPLPEMQLTINQRWTAWIAEVPAGSGVATLAIAGAGTTPTAGNFLGAGFVLRDAHAGAFDAAWAWDVNTDHARIASNIDAPADGWSLVLAVATSATGTPQGDVPSAVETVPLPSSFGALSAGSRFVGYTRPGSEVLGEVLSYTTSEPDDEGDYASLMTNTSMIAVSVAPAGAVRTVSPGYPALSVHGRIGARSGVAGEALRIDLREGFRGDYEGATITVNGSGDALPSGWSIEDRTLIAANPVAGSHSFVFDISQNGGTETATMALDVTIAASEAGNLIDLATETFDLGAATVTATTGGRQIVFGASQYSSGFTVATEPRATYRLTLAYERTAGTVPLLLRAGQRLVESGTTTNTFNDDWDGFLGEAQIGVGSGVVTLDFVAADDTTEIGVGTFYTQVTQSFVRPAASGSTVRLTYGSLRKLPETLPIGGGGTVDRVRMFDHTYVFDKARPVRRAANGAYIVHNADPAGDPVEIAAIWPPSRTRPAGAISASEAVTINGAHINWGAQFREQGLDSFFGGTGNLAYAAGRNRDPGATGRAIVFSADDAGTEGAVDKATSAERGYFQNGLVIQRLLSQTALTVSTTAPDPARTPFQPPTSVAAKSFHYVEDIPDSFFSAIPAVPVPAGESAVPFDEAMYYVHRQPQVIQNNNPAQRNMSPRYTQREYGRENSQRAETIFTALMLDSLSAAEKRDLMLQVIQRGILWDGFDRAGGSHNRVGGGSSNFKGYAVMAALALNDAAMRARLAVIGEASAYADDGFHAAVTKLIVETEKQPSTVGGYTRPLAPHILAQIGQPEHFQYDSAARRPSAGGSYSSARSTTYYRGNATSYVYAMSLFMRLYPGALAAFANPVRDDYLDRHLLMGPQRTGSTTGVPADRPPARTVALWRAHRAQGLPVSAHLFGLEHVGGGAFPPDNIPVSDPPNTNTMNDTFPAPRMWAKWQVGVEATHDVAALEFANTAMALADGEPTSFAIVAARRWTGTAFETLATPAWASVNPTTGLLTATPPDTTLWQFDVEGSNAAGSDVATVAVQAS